jgi:hypothetical protein
MQGRHLARPQPTLDGAALHEVGHCLGDPKRGDVGVCGWGGALVMALGTSSDDPDRIAGTASICRTCGCVDQPVLRSSDGGWPKILAAEAPRRTYGCMVRGRQGFPRLDKPRIASGYPP